LLSGRFSWLRAPLGLRIGLTARVAMATVSISLRKMFKFIREDSRAEARRSLWPLIGARTLVPRQPGQGGCGRCRPCLRRICRSPARSCQSGLPATAAAQTGSSPCLPASLLSAQSLAKSKASAAAWAAAATFVEDADGSESPVGRRQLQWLGLRSRKKSLRRKYASNLIKFSPAISPSATLVSWFWSLHCVLTTSVSAGAFVLPTLPLLMASVSASALISLGTGLHPGGAFGPSTGGT
uniref:Pecanex-like protein n=1 Tax=Macrostomum lignano TaxID=282301 RepID=A0A1I8GTB8_9PLAT